MCGVRVADGFKVGMGLHQGSTLSHFLFVVVRDRLADEVRQESLWRMMFADDSAICRQSRKRVEERLEKVEDRIHTWDHPSKVMGTT